MLVDLTVKEFIAKVAGSDPVPGGGSISALNAALAASLSNMVTNLTIGRKKYAEKEEQMTQLAEVMQKAIPDFLADVDKDSDAYNQVFAAFKLPKETDEEKAARSEAIQAGTRVAIDVPLEVARKAFGIMDSISEIAIHGNQNAVTDACVAMMSARTAVLGACLNVRINFSSLKDTAYVEQVSAEIEKLEKEALIKELSLYEKVKELL